MTKKRPILVLISLLAAFSLLAAACGDDDDSSSEGSSGDSGSTDDGSDDGGSSGDTDSADGGTTGADGAPLRIAIVAPSATNDVAFSQSIFEGVNRVGETRSIEVDVSDGLFVPEDAGAALRGYAEDGFDLVIAHGSQFGSFIEELAPDFPDVAFAWGTAVDTFDLPNVSAYTVRSDEGGYVMGVMAAEISEAGNIGVVGPFEVGDAELYVNGFAAGAEAQKPGIDVNVNYIESFADVALAQEAAEAFLSNGADVLTGTAQMVVGATGVASGEGIPWFGTQANQTELGPDIVVASQVYHWEVVLEQIIDDIGSDKLGGETYTATLANGGIEIEYNDGFDLDASVKELGETTTAGIIDGSITTGV